MRRRREVRWVRRPYRRRAAWGNECEQAGGSHRDDQRSRQQGREIDPIAPDLGGHDGDLLDLTVVAIVFTVVIAEQEAVVGVMRAGMADTGLHACAGVQMESDQPREDEAQTDHPEGNAVAHGQDFSTGGAAASVVLASS